jgi:hypothetical protein
MKRFTLPALSFLIIIAATLVYAAVEFVIR